MNVRPKIHLSSVQVSFFNSSSSLCILFKGLISPTRIAIHSRGCLAFLFFPSSFFFIGSPCRSILPRPIDFTLYVARSSLYDHFRQRGYERDVGKFCSPAAVSSISIPVSSSSRSATLRSLLVVFSRAD